MPTKPMPPCRWPGCPELQEPDGQGYCAEHAKERRRQDALHRGTANQRGYGYKYQQRRDWVLTHHPLCAVCKAEGRLTAAEITHHIVPLSEGGSNSASNLEPLCVYHHALRHQKGGVKHELDKGIANK